LKELAWPDYQSTFIALTTALVQFTISLRKIPILKLFLLGLLAQFISNFRIVSPFQILLLLTSFARALLALL